MKYNWKIDKAKYWSFQKTLKNPMFLVIQKMSKDIKKMET